MDGCRKERNNTNVNEYCEGCLTSYFVVGNDAHLCGNSAYNKNGECPCSRCIVKMMCEELCYDYSKFLDSTARNQVRESYERRQR